MKKRIISGVVLAALGAGATLLLARHAQGATPEAREVELTLLSRDRDTAVYTFSHAGHTCFIASTRGGSGISLQCPK